MLKFENQQYANKGHFHRFESTAFILKQRDNILMAAAIPILTIRLINGHLLLFVLLFIDHWYLINVDRNMQFKLQRLITT